MSVKHKLRTFLWKFGYDISRFKPSKHPLARRKKIFESYEIDTVLDIGANAGQFAQQIRGELGYANRIISFEPLTSAFESLKEKAKNDSNWDAYNFALGDTDQKQEINIAGNSLSSSLLDMLPAHIMAAPDSKYVGKEEIEVRKLDSIFDNLCGTSNKIYMKIDTQGFEKKVLDGAASSLMQIDLVQMEMSLVPLYEGELLFDEMCALMSEKGFSLLAIETGFSDEESCQLMQVDGIFHRV